MDRPCLMSQIETRADELIERVIQAVPASRGPAQSGSASTGIARAVLGDLDARRCVPDEDLRLRSLAFVVKVEPAGAVPPARFAPW